MLTYNPYQNHKIILFSSTPPSELAKIRARIRPFEAAPLPRPVLTRKIIDFQQLTSDEKWYHCRLLVDTLERLAYCANAVNLNSAAQLMTLFDVYGWQCWKTHTKHTANTPLSVELLVSPWRGGKLVIANCRPRYYPGWLAGEYRWGWRPDHERQQIVRAA